MTKTKRRDKGKIKKKRSLKRKSSGAGTMGSSNSPRFSFARHQQAPASLPVPTRDNPSVPTRNNPSVPTRDNPSVPTRDNNLFEFTLSPPRRNNDQGPATPYDPSQFRGFDLSRPIPSPATPRDNEPPPARTGDNSLFSFVPPPPAAMREQQQGQASTLSNFNIFTPTAPNMAIGGRINRRRKTRKTRKKIHRNRSNKSIGVKSQKGGVLFKIQDRDLEELRHIGLRGTPGEGTSCVACSMHQLRFPIELVDEATRLANARKGEGVYSLEIQELINKFLIKHNQQPVRMWSWAALKGSNPQTLSVNMAPDSGDLGENQENMQSRNMTQTALKGIFETLENGSATLLSYQTTPTDKGEVFGHITVIAKSYKDTPYLIETQATGNFQGLYRGMDNIMTNYFARQPQVGNFVTYSSTEPRLNGGIWKVENEPVLNLEPDKNSPKGYDGTTRSLLPPERLESFTVQAETAAARQQAHRAAEMRAAEMRAAEMRAAEMRAAEMRAVNEEAMKRVEESNRAWLASHVDEIRRRDAAEAAVASRADETRSMDEFMKQVVKAEVARMPAVLRPARAETHSVDDEAREERARELHAKIREARQIYRQVYGKLRSESEKVKAKMLAAQFAGEMHTAEARLEEYKKLKNDIKKVEHDLKTHLDYLRKHFS